MKYQVVLTARAINDLEDARNYLSALAPETAVAWHHRFLNALLLLQTNPSAWPVAPESKEFEFELRQFLFRTRSRRANRALFTIVGQEVRVLAIRRPGQPLVSKDDLMESSDG